MEERLVGLSTGATVRAQIRVDSECRAQTTTRRPCEDKDSEDTEQHRTMRSKHFVAGCSQSCSELEPASVPVSAIELPQTSEERMSKSNGNITANYTYSICCCRGRHNHTRSRFSWRRRRNCRTTLTVSNNKPFAAVRRLAGTVRIRLDIVRSASAKTKQPKRRAPTAQIVVEQIDARGARQPGIAHFSRAIEEHG